MARAYEGLSRPDIRRLEGDHCYVLNTSDREGTETRSELLITVPTPGVTHNAINVSIPNTWIPIDLTSQMSMATIKENRDFWYHINRKDITVITSEIAEEMLEEADAREEYKRVYDIGQPDKRAPAMFETKEDNIYDRASAGMRDKVSKGNLRKEEGSTKVLAIMNRDIPENQKLAALKNIRHELKATDYKYIVKTAKTGDQEKLKSWASVSLAELP